MRLEPVINEFVEKHVTLVEVGERPDKEKLYCVAEHGIPFSFPVLKWEAERDLAKAKESAKFAIKMFLSYIGN